MVKAKQGPNKIRAQQQQEQQQQEQQHNQKHTKSNAKSRLSSVAIMKTTIQQPNVMTVLKADPSFTKPLVIPKKRKPKKQQDQPIRRSLLMTNALLPLMPVTRKKKSDEGPQNVEGSATGRHRVSGNATQTLLVIRDSLEHLMHTKKLSKLEKVEKHKVVPSSHQPVSVEPFYNKGHHVGSHRLTPMPFKHSERSHLSGGKGGGDNNAASHYGNSTSGVKQNSKNNYMEVPLTTRLPIIDFLSTDDFARTQISKKQRAAKRAALTK